MAGPLWPVLFFSDYSFNRPGIHFSKCAKNNLRYHPRQQAIADAREYIAVYYNTKTPAFNIVFQSNDTA
jgi:hypothetical protein